ncbi:hypothetical protein UA08_01779 [Talaromyces atroroseus]|uniref:Uncharacterized protein n=1 Tax=Talaromyces atroroseus TaxID=1441469 RepID=A0A1Q5QBX0_TALAT|nr:hypothetical protein UA08_01779 [Talaromyces atroroseus]OKL63406.1 hypothetical protein UA08_01779 [Talaromyces atroroseus]
MFVTVENHLIKHGHIGVAVKVQNFAKLFENSESKKSQQKWIKDQLYQQFWAMTIIQAEIYFSQEIKALEKLEGVNDTGLTDEEKSLLSCLKKKLSFSGENWWFITHNIHRNWFQKPKGPYIRNYELYQKGYLTHTEKEMQLACKAEGGCCAWGCGCCYRRIVAVVYEEDQEDMTIRLREMKEDGQ